MSAKASYVKRARKDYPAHNIKRGESYWWWKFNFAPKQVSKTRPRRSQLTRSDFWGAIYDMQDANGDGPRLGDIENRIIDITAMLEEIRNEVQNKLDSMPEALQEASVLNGRIAACEEAINTLNAVEVPIPALDGDGNDEEKADEVWQEVIDALDNISCD